MKGQIIQQLVHDSILDWTHGAGYHVKRIVIPNANDLAITSHGGQLYAVVGYKDEYEVLGEVDVPDALVEEALTFVRAKDRFDGFREQFDALLTNSE